MSGSYSDLTLYRRLLAQARPYWPHLGALFGLGLLTTPIALLVPVPLKIVVDSVLGTRPLPGVLGAWFPAAQHSPRTGLAIAIGVLLAVTLLAQLQSLLNTWLRAYVGEHIVLGFRSRLLEQGQRLSLSYHDSTGTADTVYRIQHDAPALQYVAVDGIIPFVSAAISLIAMIAVTARLDWQLALVALTISPVLFVLSRTFRRRMRGQSRAVKKLESSALQVVQEILGALRVVKAFGQERRETERFQGRAHEGLAARLRLALVEGRFGLWVGLTTAGGTAAVLYLGVGHVRSGVLTLGELLMVMSYLAQLYQPLATISRKAAGLQSYLASAERAFTLLDEVSDVPERPDARSLTRASGAVEFQRVSFAYDADRAVLHDVSFTVAPGTRVAVTGATGAGKTTLVNLLTRFYDPTGGAVLLDGVDLRDYRVVDLRRQFAIVLQHPLLFSTTIAENIAYGRPGASREAVEEAAGAANAHEFIARLPHGYATQVGELGQKLSGGERQRIALARAFLRDAPVLILDEPTSSVDLKTEAVILEALERLMATRTVFLITHRPSTWTMCDVRLQLDRGRLIPEVRPAVEAIAGRDAER
jgi:ATP-binding cassette, subfamily B, bacterial